MDYRGEIVKRLESCLISKMDSEMVREVTNNILVILEDYEVQTRCTEVAVVETPNEQIIKMYTASLAIEGKSKATIAQYIRVCLKFSDYINKPITEVTDYEVKAYLAVCKSRGIKNITLEGIRAYLSAFFNWLESEELIVKSPCRSIKPIKCEYEIKLPFSKIEMDALKSNCENIRERAIIEVLISSGVRVSELTNAKIADIDFKNLKFHVKNGKGGKDRTTFITDVAATHLQKYLETRNDISEFLFVTRLRDKFSTNAVRDLLNKIAVRANVENVHPHRFRRTFATNLANRGMDIQEIKTLMGHSDINTTLMYVYTSDIKVAESYKRFS